jgi:hypothetical protein
VITFGGKSIFEFLSKTIDPSFAPPFIPSLKGSNLISMPVAPPDKTNGRKKVFFS